MSKELKTQWHPAFVSAMKLELIEDAEYLDYTSLLCKQRQSFSDTDYCIKTISEGESEVVDTIKQGFE